MVASLVAIAADLLSAHAAAQHDQMLDAGRQPLGQGIEMLVALGQHQRRSTFVNGLEHVIADELIAGLVRDQLASTALGTGFARSSAAAPVGRKPVGTDMDGMFEGACGCLRLGVDPMTNRSALHEDDRMVPVFASDRGGQARDELCLCLADDLLETVRGQVVAFVHDEMSVIADQIIHDSLARQALNERHVERPGRLLSPAADSADLLRRQAQKRCQALDPLFQQLPAMDENQRIDAALGDQPCGDDGFSEGGRGGEHAGVVGQHGLGGDLLLGLQLAVETHIQRPARIALVSQNGVDVQIRQQLLHLVQATARQADVLSDNPRHSR